MRIHARQFDPCCVLGALKITAITLLLITVLRNDGLAHDTWIETNTSLVRVGEVVHVDLKLGNHGNHHRDFLLAGRINPEWVTLEVASDQGKRESLREQLTPTAAAEKEGFWTTSYSPRSSGTFTVVQTLDRVMKHGKSVRGVRSAKALFIASESLDNPQVSTTTGLAPLGLSYELVLESCPLRQVAVAQPLTVKVLKDGKPQANVLVSFIPRGEKLADEFDPRFERRTDAQGRASFTPSKATVHLIAARQNAEDEKSDAYEYTSYCATLTVQVPKAPLAKAP
jgi:uncharacterized GH25 family protein